MIGKLMRFIRKVFDSNYSDKVVDRTKTNQLEKIREVTSRTRKARRIAESIDYDLIIYKQVGGGRHGN